MFFADVKRQIFFFADVELYIYSFYEFLTIFFSKMKIFYPFVFSVFVNELCIQRTTSFFL